MDAGKGTQNGQRDDQGQGSNPGVGPSQRPEGAVPETASEGVLSQILAAIQGLAQSSVAVQGTMLEVIQRLPVPAAQGGEATSSASESGSRQPASQEGSQGARQEPQSVGTASDPAGQVPRARDDADRYTKEKFMKNGAKEYEGGIDPVKAENWINNMETTFRAMKVPPQHQTRLASVMLGGEAFHWWHTEEGSTFRGREIEDIAWNEFVDKFNEQYFPEPVAQKKAMEFHNLVQGADSVREYARKFMQLERFSPGLLHNEKARCNKFF